MILTDKYGCCNEPLEYQKVGKKCCGSTNEEFKNLYKQLSLPDITEDALNREFGLFNKMMPREFIDSVLAALKGMKDSGIDNEGITGTLSILSVTFSTQTEYKNLVVQNELNITIAQFDYTPDGLRSMIEAIKKSEFGAAPKTVDALDLFFGYFMSAWGTPANTQKNSDTDRQIEQFVSELREKGAAAYLQKVNEEKIEEKLKQKRTELESQYGLNSEPPLDDGAKAKAVEAINKQMEEYKKELLENQKKKSELESGKPPRLNELLTI